jgi:Predicted Zn peptidase
MFSPVRLRLARQRRALTLTKLADLSGVSLRSLSNYENNAIEQPTEESLRKLAETLGVRPDYFYRDEVDPVAVEAVSFRKLSKTSASKRDAALASATLALEFFGIVDRHFRLPEPSIPTFDKLAPDQGAELVRQRWGLGDRPITNMVHLLESKGVRVVSLGPHHSDIDAFCFYRDAVPYVFVNTMKSGERQRFDIAHELGHLVMHDERDMTPSDSRDREAEANAFAAAFLMPASGLHAQALWGASLQKITAAKRHWKVSAMAMSHRLHELGLLNDWQYRSTVVALSKAGYRSSEPGGMVPETSQLLRKVMFGPTGISLGTVATELAVSAHDLGSLVHGLVPVAA